MRRAEFNPWRQFTEFNYLGWQLGFESPKTIVIHGGGWAGLSLGTFLKAFNFHDFQIYEPHHVGGLIDTRETPYGLRETAANGFLDGSPAMDELIRILGLKPISSREESQKKFIVRNGKLTALPSSAADFFSEPFVGAGSKAMMFPRLLKFLLWAKPSPRWSVAEFAKRALGTEISQVLAPALVSGIYGGSAHDICLGTAFPQVYSRFEKAPQKKAGRKKKLMSFEGGMAESTRAMKQFLSDHIVSTLPAHSYDPGRRLLHISTVPVHSLGQVLPGALEDLVRMASLIEYAPIVSIVSFAPKSFFQNQPEGFGVLIPPSENFKSLGVLFNDCIFPNRTQDPTVSSMTFLMGGTRLPKAVEWSDENLIAAAHDEARKLFGLRGNFLYADCIKIPKAIPQYTATLGEFWESAQRALVTHNWNAMHQWILFGNYTGQVSLRGMTEGAFQLAKELTEFQS